MCVYGVSCGRLKMQSENEFSTLPFKYSEYRSIMTLLKIHTYIVLNTPCHSIVCNLCKMKKNDHERLHFRMLFEL